MEDTGKIRFRSARDILVDQFIGPMVMTYPLPDIPFSAQKSKVLYNYSGTLQLDLPQEDCKYVIYDEEGEEIISSYTLENEQLIAVTDKLTREDYTFSVLVKKNRDFGPEKSLLDTVTIKVGVDDDIPVEIVPAQVIYNQPVTVKLSQTQSNAQYQVFDMQDKALSKLVDSGDGGDLSILTDPFTEDTQIKVCVTNKKTKETGTIITQPTVLVFPNDGLVPVLTGADAGIDYDGTAEITIEGAQASVDYQLIWEDLDICVNQPDQVTMRAGLTGTKMGSVSKLKGTETAVKLKTTKLTEDPTFSILAVKRNSGLSLKLVQRVFVPVKPDPTRTLSVVETTINPGGTGTVQVNNPQRGVAYQLVAASGTDTGERVYYHKNYGVGLARIGVEFAVDEKPDNSVFLAAGVLNADATFTVRARKATTQKTNNLNDSVTVKVTPLG